MRTFQKRDEGPNIHDINVCFSFFLLHLQLPLHETLKRIEKEKRRKRKEEKKKKKRQRKRRENESIQE